MFKKLSALFLFFICIIFFLSNCNIKKDSPLNPKLLQVHYIDVNQGDSILIQVNNKNMLIDSGPRESRTSLINYLKKLNISKIDYLIATHPHEDHIGNMAYIIKNFNTKSFYAPKIQSNSKCFEEIILALKKRNLKINILDSTTNSINLGEGTKLDIYTEKVNSSSTNKDINLNNYSPLIHLDYGDTSFLFTGDLEKDGEQSILSTNCSLKSTVLKVGHHGSSSSTSENFLKSISPSLAIISVGKDNPYGHPHNETINLLTKYNIPILRTDLNGTITLYSDGKKLYKNK